MQIISVELKTTYSPTSFAGNSDYISSKWARSMFAIVGECKGEIVLVCNNLHSTDYY